MQNSALYLEVPDRILDAATIADPGLLIPSFTTRVADSIKRVVATQVEELVKRGVDVKVAQAQVADAIAKIGYYDAKEGKYVIEPIVRRVNDSILTNLTGRFWNISQINKVFRQPLLRGYSDHLVTKVGVPNIWADFVQIFTAGYEGKARVSAVAHTTGEINTSIAAKSRTGTMLSEVINLLIDYESPSPNEQILGGQPTAGNWLVGTEVGERDAYANLMLDQLMTLLIYFGHAETGFEGLTQIADRDDAVEYYDSLKPPAQYLWENDATNLTVGADLLLMLNHFIADKMEELYFLPTDCRISCSPILYKALKFSMLSKVYNQNSPLSIIATAFDAGNKIAGTLATRSGDSLYRSFELVPDPMLMPNTPFNDTDEDLMFITFPTIMDELSGTQTDLVMAPTLIDKMVLPSAPAWREGTVRTSLKRIGSLLCPLRKTVHIISGMGTNSRY